MILAHIARTVGLTRGELQTFAPFHDRAEQIRRDQGLRQFIRLAFADGHDLDMIARHIGRTEEMVLHVLRMVCVDEYGCGYGQTRAEIERILRPG